MCKKTPHLIKNISIKNNIKFQFAVVLILH